jgi:hypothetical protein
MPTPWPASTALPFHHLAVERMPPPRTPPARRRRLRQPKLPPDVLRAEARDAEQVLGRSIRWRSRKAGVQTGVAWSGTGNARAGPATGQGPCGSPHRHRRGRNRPSRDVGVQAHRELRPLDLEGAEPRREPVRGEGLGGADGEHAFILADQRPESILTAVEGADDQRRGAAARLRSASRGAWSGGTAARRAAPRAADLIAHRRLGHAELGGGAGEVFVPRGGFEDLDGAEGREGGAWQKMISSAYLDCRDFRWRRGAAAAT